MKNSTQTKLDHAASVLASAFVSDISYGHTSKSDCDAVRAGRSDIEFMKSALRHDKHQISAVLDTADFKIANVLKTSRQLNYLANEIVYRLRAGKLPAYKQVVRMVFATRGK